MNTFAALLTAPGNSVILQVKFAVLHMQKCLRPLTCSITNPMDYLTSGVLPGLTVDAIWSHSLCFKMSLIYPSAPADLQTFLIRLFLLVHPQNGQAWPGNHGFAAHHLFFPKCSLK